jgi:hypothetical protein
VRVSWEEEGGRDAAEHRHEDSEEIQLEPEVITLELDVDTAPRHFISNDVVNNGVASNGVMEKNTGFEESEPEEPQRKKMKKKDDDVLDVEEGLVRADSMYSGSSEGSGQDVTWQRLPIV